MSYYLDDPIRGLVMVHTCGGSIGCVRCVTDARSEARTESKKQIGALRRRCAALYAVLRAAKPAIDGTVAATTTLRRRVSAALAAEERAAKAAKEGA